MSSWGSRRDAHADPGAVDAPRGPLAGTRVLDFGQYLAGPAAAMLLADQGADVIRIDPPDGPRWKSPANAVLNRGKRSIVLDLKDRHDRDTARGMAATADVVVENFRPGVMARLGLDPHELAAMNPRLVCVSLPGFAADDPEYAGVQAWEGVIAAAVGLYMDMGLNRLLRGRLPSYTALPMASAYGAVLGAVAVAVALVARERTGLGDVLEVPLASAVLEGLAYNSMDVTGLPERYRSPRGREIERRRRMGLPMDLTYAEITELLDPLYQSYWCADGRPLFLGPAGHRRHVERLLLALGLWDDLVAGGLPTLDPYTRSREWPPRTDCTVYAFPLCGEWALRLREALRERLRQRTAFEWETLLSQKGVPAAAQRTTREWLSSDHARASGLVVEVDDPEYGRMWQAGPAAWSQAYADTVTRPRPAPRLDSDRDELLAELEEQAQSRGGADPCAPRAGGRRELPLSGLRVVDVTNVIAGPTVAATLARFGAEVVKVDPPRTGFDPSTTILLGLQANRGKRSLLLDLRAPEGRRILERLVADADVVTFNGPERQLASLGLDLGTLRILNPRVVLCHFTAFGGPHGGPRGEQLGYDDLAQASTGVMERFGGSLETPEEHAHVGTVDVISGFCGVFATALGLLERERRDGAVRVQSCLAAAAQLIQLPFMYDFSGRAPFDEPRGPDALGEHALYRLYRAGDGWFFLGTRFACPADWRQVPELARLATIAELSDIRECAERSDPGAVLTAFLEERFAVRPVRYWIEQLRALDLGAHEVRTMADVRAAHTVRESDGEPDLDGPTVLYVEHDSHPLGRPVSLVAPNGVRMRRGRVRLPSPAVQPGAHSRTLLHELGCSEREIDDLIARGTVGERWSEDYLPD